MKIPVLFGCPLYKNMKRRVANKYIKELHWAMSLRSAGWEEWTEEVGHIRVGDLYSDCFGYNRRATYIEPNYAGMGNGQILIDIDIGNEVGGSCSLFHCHPGPPKSREEVEQYRQSIINRPDARNWNWDITYSPEVMTVNPDGTVTINHELEKRLIEERKQHGV